MEMGKLLLTKGVHVVLCLVLAVVSISDIDDNKSISVPIERKATKTIIVGVTLMVTSFVVGVATTAVIIKLSEFEKKGKLSEGVGDIGMPPGFPEIQNGQ